MHRDGAVELTARGREVLDRLVAARRATLTGLLEGWSPEEHPELADALQRLASAFVAEAPA